ncbi:MAG: homocysteine S-methyltransferase family protein [Cyanobacteria bacterium P01_G01_bin.38]
MTRYPQGLPQLSDTLFITDGGLETTLIFHEGHHLPYFAAYDLLKQPFGIESLRKYFCTYAQLAYLYGVGFVLESPTWRASADWGEKLGDSAEDLAALNRKSIELLHDIREEYETGRSPMVVSGCVGPRGDGYSPTETMSSQDAEHYHTAQIQTFHEAGADMASAITMTYPAEAIGITRAAQAAGLPAVISFTVETDGRLPNGQTLQSAIEQVDSATEHGPAYYMINCAHPTHFEHLFQVPAAWQERIRGIRANASIKSHAELDEAETLDDGNPVELGAQYHKLRQQLPHINVVGGCCGTDHRHIESIWQACAGFVSAVT